MPKTDMLHTMAQSDDQPTVAQKNLTPNLSESSDAELLRLFRTTRLDEAFDMVQARYRRLVDYVLRAELPARFADADALADLAQDVWMKLLRGVQSGVVNLDERESLKSYIARMAQNGVRNFVQLKRHQFQHVGESSDCRPRDDDGSEARNPMLLLVCGAPNPREHTERRRLTQRVREGIGKLTAREQRVVRLMMAEEMTIEQMAAALRTNVSMIKRLKASARAKLRCYV